MKYSYETVQLLFYENNYIVLMLLVANNCTLKQFKGILNNSEVKYIFTVYTKYDYYTNNW